MLTCLLSGISIAGCAGGAMYSDVNQASESSGASSRVPRPVVINENASQGIMPDDAGITLEFASLTPRGLSFILSNNSGYDIRYGDGYYIAGNQWGYAGNADNEFNSLPSGESKVVDVQIDGIGFGEFRITKNIVIDPGSPTNAREYELVAEFAIENTTISSGIRGVVMEVDADFATSNGVMIEIINGFECGRIYYDKSFWLQRKSNGIWCDVTAIGSESFLYDTISMASGQISKIIIYWEWLYGALPPGEYRLGKSFLHHMDDGEDAQYDLCAVFFLDGNPASNTVEKADGSTWQHPLSGVTTLRAEVTELLSPGYHHMSFGNSGLLVSGLTPIGDRFMVFSNCLVLDSNGRHMRFSDIKIGTIVDITHSGLVLTMSPAILGNVYLVTIVE